MRDRKLTHEAIMARAEREVALESMQNESALDELRASLVEKYGEDGVRKVENSVISERDKQYAKADKESEWKR